MTIVSGGFAGPRSDVFVTAEPLRRGPLLVTAALAAFGAASVTAVALPTLWRTWQLYAMLFGVLAAVELAAVIALLGWPTQRTIRFGALSAGAPLLLWILDRPAGVLPAPDPWLAADAVLGVTDHLVAGLQVVAAVGLLAVAARGPRPEPSVLRWILSSVALFPVTMLVLAVSATGLTTASDGFTGTGVPPDAVAPASLPAGQASTVEYCRPDGIALAMDLYTPAAGAGPAPVALYVHGGGLVAGSRKPDGPGAALARSDGAVFTPVRQALNARGYVVASIDYRLAPAAPWPAQLTDAKCAVRFLKARAGQLGIDPTRIAVWGADAGGLLSALLGTTGQDAGFDVGQYADQPSTVRAVVALSCPADLTPDGADPITRAILFVGLGRNPATLRAASPATYVTPGAPPFLVLQGEDVLGRQAADLAARLSEAGVPVTLTRDSAPQQLTGSIVTFLTQTLKE